ncbi:protein involved in polysaccharide export with SLBB domain [Povalibacter uvarum]|uniref:Protein involved in polysaccharide export with SLBB domain n=1 Tax=Povalibacter uvarum TaxID=732238 RepID=A0A841HGN7_9GAMM|nr:SLBB domain-containing protein [Povalibacter uvarum]MBB6091599.1 protein involved in polysaccharide export with SLBB domain [Povalibacter uvarum]
MVRNRTTGPLSGLALLLAVCGSTLLSPVHAQVPSAEQMEMFQTLPPDQQQAILESLGTNGTGASGAQRGVRSDRQLSFPRTVVPRVRADDQLLQDGLQSEREPRLKGEDTILLSLELREFERSFEQERIERERKDREFDPRVVSQPAIPGRVPGANETDASAGQSPRKAIVRSEYDIRRLEDFRDRVMRRNPYKLDKWGILNVAELGPVPLGGLTVEEARQRLSAEPTLKDFHIDVLRLPLRPVGAESLKPFGYDLFAGLTSTFAPATDVPVPSEYVVGPGDNIEVQLTGNIKGRYSLVVGRDGRVNFPELGPIAVGGMRFEEVRAMLESRVQEQMVGTQANVAIGELRSIRVFVLGDVETPGSYTVSGLSTITNALFVSGGVKKIGSLRNIELKRNGATVTRLDLYDLLLKGDTRADARLLPGDVIFIPPVGATVGLSGDVRRPAIYELRGETSAAELVGLGGGLTPQADAKLATIERVSDDRQRVIIDIDLSKQSTRTVVMRGGDVLRVPSIRPVLEESVALGGYVYRPGEFQYRAGMRLTDLIPSVDELKPNADQRYVLIRRELPPDRKISVFSADLARAIGAPNSAANFELAPRDRVYVFDLESGRDPVVAPLMRELRLQSNLDEPTREVSVAGRIKIPGTYPYEPGMRVADLLRAGGTLDESAYGGQAELTRYSVTNGQAREAELIEIDLRRVVEGDPVANIALQPFDFLVIKEVPLWGAQEEVEIMGEVKFPGRYPIHRGETLRSVMQRAGGVTDLAFVPGSVFTRVELRERERKQIETLANRMQSDVAQVSLQAAQETGKDAGQALAVGQSLLTDLRNAKPVGRLVIDLEQSMVAVPSSEQDIVLKDGDRLLVPRITQEVTVIGEVQSTTSHLYNPAIGRDEYVQMSGGLTARADEDRIYVVRADGSVVVNQGNAWFSGGRVDIRPGDTIVVPLDTERMRPLPFWTAVTTIIYNLAISVAAVNSF